ncbi:MAG: NAD(P)/FAD-dependent oxidoreductase [Streptosporangiales bacterium]|nr:NAD(P)/FAD-dependent oxidoreductase [Streptosporangiales bacterium]
MTMPAATEASNDTEYADFLIVGAGISGIGAAHHMRERFPDRSLVILEGRERPGGTWWTHRYPGVRSDSDLHTYGYRFKPWRGPAIASGPAILDYLDEVIADDSLDERIRYNQRVTEASWSSEARRWTVTTARGQTYTAAFLWMCPGYYDHDQPHQPGWPGLDDYTGQVIHPQRWPDGLGLAGKRVAVIGSGATAATIVPAIAQDAAHVTMVQRSPSYFLAPPRQNELAETLRALDIPEEWTHEILRRSYIARSDDLVRMSFDEPDELHKFFIEEMRPQLPEGFDIDKHFTPRYRPWQQRLGIVPEGDFFAALRDGTADIVTGTIGTFTETGLRVDTGEGTEEIDADIVVTATGFTMSLFGGIAFTVDGDPVDFTGRVTWRGLMISGVPSMAYVFGYLRYSWTLRADLVCDLVARMLEHMEARGAATVVPVPPEDLEHRPFCDPENFSAGYIMRAQDRLFKQGDREPWIHLLEYHEERDTLPAADLDDGTLFYS